MSEPLPIAAARRFRDLVTTDQPPSLAELSRSLDALVLAVQDAPESEPTADDAEPPAGDYQTAYDRIGARFPDLGYYSIADPLDVPAAGEPMIGDAIDDLVDIARDLEEGLWLFDNIGRDDAIWHLRSTYGTHWGRHARELSLYLHARQFA